jgi:hypothetical protein
MADWVTISSLATATGTLVLAAATFSSVRSSNRSAKIAQQALEAGVRPVLFQSRDDDPDQEIMWGDRHWEVVSGGGAVVAHRGDTVYLAISLRNVGQGIAVLRAWRAGRSYYLSDGETTSDELAAMFNSPPDTDLFRPQGRDLYVPSGDTSFWQAAVRGWDDEMYSEVVTAITDDHALWVDLLYGDHEGGQRMISRFSITKGANPEQRRLRASVTRHWNLDREDPR